MKTIRRLPQRYGHTQVSVHSNCQEWENRSLSQYQHHTADCQAGMKRYLNPTVHQHRQRHCHHSHQKICNGQRRDKTESGLTKGPSQTHGPHHQHIAQRARHRDEELQRRVDLPHHDEQTLQALLGKYLTTSEDGYKDVCPDTNTLTHTPWCSVCISGGLISTHQACFWTDNFIQTHICTSSANSTCRRTEIMTLNSRSRRKLRKSSRWYLDLGGFHVWRRRGLCDILPVFLPSSESTKFQSLLLFGSAQK